MSNTETGGNPAPTVRNYRSPANLQLQCGMWQTTDRRGGEIDMVADVQIDGEAVTIHDPAELMQAIAESSAAKRKYVERLVAFAYERDSESDACWVDTLAARAAGPDYSVLDLLADLTQAPSFGVRARDP